MAALWWLASAASCGSCERDRASSGRLGGEASGEKASRPSLPEPAEPPYAIVEGVVRLDEAADALPRYRWADLGIDEEHPVPREGCPPLAQLEREALQPVRMGTGRGLGPVLVTVVGFRRAPAVPNRVHHVRIDPERCLLSPSLVAARVGDALVVHNDSDYPFLPTLGSSAFTQAVLKGEQRRFELRQGGVFVLRCVFAASCGRTDVVVLRHPVYAVTDEQGHFRIEKVPVEPLEGRSIEIYAWHPLFGEARRQLSREQLQPGQRIRVELVLSPRPRPETPAPKPAPPRGGTEPGAELQ